MTGVSADDSHEESVGSVDDILASKEDADPLGAWLDMRKMREGELQGGDGHHSCGRDGRWANRRTGRRGGRECRERNRVLTSCTQG